MPTYNVIGDADVLEQLLREFPSISLEEKFAAGDWDVRVPTDTVDDFSEWCDTHRVAYQLV